MRMNPASPTTTPTNDHFMDDFAFSNWLSSPAASRYRNPEIKKPMIPTKPKMPKNHIIKFRKRSARSDSGRPDSDPKNCHPSHCARARNGARRMTDVMEKNILLKNIRRISFLQHSTKKKKREAHSRFLCA